MMTKNNFRILSLILTGFLLLFLGACGAHQVSPIPTEPMPIQSTLLPVNSFGIGNIASLSIQEANNSTPEDMVKQLVSRWLESYKTTTGSDAIKDYTIGNITIQPNSEKYSIVAKVIFSVEPVIYSQNWASLATSTSSSNDPWLHLGTTFGIVRDGSYFRLNLLPGWGT